MGCSRLSLQLFCLLRLVEWLLKLLLRLWKKRAPVLLLLLPSLMACLLLLEVLLLHLMKKAGAGLCPLELAQKNLQSREGRRGIGGGGCGCDSCCVSCALPVLLQAPSPHPR